MLVRRKLSVCGALQEQTKMTASAPKKRKIHRHTKIQRNNGTDEAARNEIIYLNEVKKKNRNEANDSKFFNIRSGVRRCEAPMQRTWKLKSMQR